MSDLDTESLPMPYWADTLLEALDDARQRQQSPNWAEITRMIGNALEVDVCSIYFYDEDSEELVLSATVGLRHQSVGKVRMRLDEGLVGLVGEECGPVMVHEAPDHPRFKYFEEAGEDPFHSFLGLPLLVGSRLRGVLVVQTIEPRLFAEDECLLLADAAERLADLMVYED